MSSTRKLAGAPSSPLLPPASGGSEEELLTRSPLQRERGRGEGTSPRRRARASAPPLPWTEAVLDGALLGAFMLVTCLLGVLLDHPAAAGPRLAPDPLARRALFAAAVALTAIAIMYSPMGRRSGAHLNPATTLAFLRLGKLRRPVAALYVAAQLLGGVTGVLVAWAVLGERLADPAVHFVTTRPGPAGAAVAFVAEVAIAFVLMSAVLALSASRHAAWTGVAAGLLVFLFITVEAPLSGTSLNPARSIASAAAAALAGRPEPLLVYLVAPPLGMLAAAEAMRARARRACAKLVHAAPCHFCGAPAPRSGVDGR